MSTLPRELNVTTPEVTFTYIDGAETDGTIGAGSTCRCGASNGRWESAIISTTVRSAVFCVFPAMYGIHGPSSDLSSHLVTWILYNG
jgi:hypothetical protein